MRDSQSLLEQLLAFAPQRITVADVHGMLGTAGDERLMALVRAPDRRATRPPSWPSWMPRSSGRRRGPASWSSCSAISAIAWRRPWAVRPTRFYTVLAATAPRRCGRQNAGAANHPGGHADPRPNAGPDAREHAGRESWPNWPSCGSPIRGPRRTGQLDRTASVGPGFRGGCGQDAGDARPAPGNRPPRSRRSVASPGCAAAGAAGRKKKPELEAARPGPPEEELAVDDAEEPSTGPESAGLSTQNASAVWLQALERVRGTIVDQAKQYCRVEAAHGNRLVVYFPPTAALAKTMSAGAIPWPISSRP